LGERKGGGWWEVGRRRGNGEGTRRRRSGERRIRDRS